MKTWLNIQKSISVAPYTKRLKKEKKNHMIVSINTEKASAQV